jgi:hypothetical protein
MKKLPIIYSLFSILCIGAADANVNPFFGEKQNQIMLNLGQGVNSFSLIPVPDFLVPYNMAALTYSQPATVFRLPARQNFTVTQTVGYGRKYQYTDHLDTFEWNWNEYNTTIASITWDVALLHGDRWYFGAGMGLAMQGRQTVRECTKFLIPFRVFFGYRITDSWNLELFTQHFSNGDAGGEGFLSDKMAHGGNYSYNFFGVGIGYNF